jgi:hypothetical protein
VRIHFLIFFLISNLPIQSFGNSPKLFEATCAELFARMIDTVPTGVELSEVINPLPIRPDLVDIVLLGDKLGLSGSVRVRTASKVCHQILTSPPVIQHFDGK